MTQRKPLIAANWKMNAPPSGWDSDDSPYRTKEGVDIVVFPPCIDIRTCVEKFLVVGAQYGRPEPKGAFTGDISMDLLAMHGCAYVLCGHSERRQHHGESDTFISEQVSAAIASGLHPVLCIGETADERQQGKTKEIIQRQLSSALSHSQSSILHSQFSIAYEPVWAIGNGHSATPADIQEMHAYIRSLLPGDIKDTTRLLYGGSVKPENAAEILSQTDVDGALIGAASLDPKAFRAIVDSLPS